MRTAVLFDMDGVITDTERFYIEGLMELLKKEGKDVTPEDLSDLMGSTLIHNCHVLKERYHLPDEPEKYVEYVHAYRDHEIEAGGLQPMDGVLELIKALHEKGIKLAVASSSPYDTIIHNMKTLGILDCFGTIVSGLDCEHGKPAPDIYLKAAENLGAQPEECIVIEDSHNGVIAGKAAGMYCYAYVPPQAYRQDLSAADSVIESYRDISVEEILGN